MFEDLTYKLESAFKKIRGQGKLTEKNISDALREVRRILLDADVNYKVAKEFIEKVEKKALGKEVIASITPGQLIIKIIHDEMVELLGGKTAPLVIANTPPSVYLLAGLQGSGKTTFAGKLARYLNNIKLRPLLVACDIYRPAAVEQLKILGKQIGVEVFHLDKNPIEIAKEAIEYAKKNGFSAVVIDSAGRLHIDEEMMVEISRLKEVSNPTETFFVVDSMIGQDAVNTAKAFHDRIAYDGIVLTKLDGDTKGGCALSIRAVVNKPIKFVSLGEKLDSIEIFHPDRMASRILGKGDIVTLVEKAQNAFEERQAEKLEEKLRSNKFDFEDFRDQLKLIKKLGSLSQILSMIPGLGSKIKDVNVDEKALVRVEAIINSMTKEERRNPRLLNASRKRRIARGSGTSIQEVNRLVKQFEEMQKMIKKLNSMDFKKAFRNFNLKLN